MMEWIVCWRKKNVTNRINNDVRSFHQPLFSIKSLMNLELSCIMNVGHLVQCSIPFSFSSALSFSYCFDQHVEKWIMMHSFRLQYIKMVPMLNENMLANVYSMACQQIHPSNWIEISKHCQTILHSIYASRNNILLRAYLPIFQQLRASFIPLFKQVFG